MGSKDRGQRTSPLRDRALNAAGESGEERCQTLLLEHFAPWVMVCVMLALMAGLEWLRWLASAPPNPLAYTIVAAVAVGLLFVRVLPRLREAGFRLSIGIEGEKHVAEVMDQLKGDGYRIIHDIVERDYNIDHVLLGPTGVYVIETKTRSKRSDRRDVRVSYDGRRILVDGQEPDRDPLKQVRAAADRVAEILRQHTGLQPPVRPVVLFPGWYVEPQPKGVPIWVLNPKALPAWARNEPTRLSAREVSVLTAALESHARSAPTGGEASAP